MSWGTLIHSKIQILYLRFNIIILFLYLDSGMTVSLFFYVKLNIEEIQFHKRRGISWLAVRTIALAGPVFHGVGSYLCKDTKKAFWSVLSLVYL
jgi:hypothetical protein